MKKNLFKKIVTAIVTTAMAVGVIAAPAMEAEAATTKTVYIQLSEGSEDKNVAMNFWNWTGVTASEHLTTGAFDGWAPGPVAFEKVEAGLYKAELTIDSATFVESGNGISIYYGYTDAAEGDKMEVDPEWNNTANWDAVKTALLSTDTEMCIALDTTNWIPSLGEVPEVESDDDGNTETESSENTNTDTNTNTNTDTNTGNAGTPDTGDTAMVALYLVIAVAAAVVVLKKRSVTE